VISWPRFAQVDCPVESSFGATVFSCRLASGVLQPLVEQEDEFTHDSAAGGQGSVMADAVVGPRRCAGAMDAPQRAPTNDPRLGPFDSAQGRGHRPRLQFFWSRLSWHIGTLPVAFEPRIMHDGGGVGLWGTEG